MRHSIFCVVLLAAPAARADGNELAIGGGSRALRSASADAVTADSLGMGSLGYAHALDIGPVPRLALWAEAGFDWGSATGTMFQTHATKVSTEVVVVGLRAHYTLHRLIDATARVDLGTARTALSLDNASDSGWGAVAEGALGVDLFASRSPTFGIGLRTELGYTATSAVAITPHTDQPSDTLKLQMIESSIGHLDLSGPWFGISVIGTF